MITIREAEAWDVQAVVRLWHVCALTRPWNDPASDFDRALAFSGSTVFVAEAGAKLVGSAMTGFDGHRGWVYYLAVAPENRRQGVARDLLERCVAWLGERGCPKVELMVREGNPDSAVYEWLGWDAQPVRVYARWIDGSDQ